jgi:hypothetical protein
MGGRVLSRNTIRQHLRQYRRDPTFKTSMLVCPPYPGRAMLCSYSEVECLNSEYREVDVLQHPHILALASKALNSVLKGSAESRRQGLGRLLTAQESQLLNWRADVYDGQWGPLPIPKLTPFTYWNRLWEVKVSNFSIHGLGLVCIGICKGGRGITSFFRVIVHEVRVQDCITGKSMFHTIRTAGGERCIPRRGCSLWKCSWVHQQLCWKVEPLQCLMGIFVPAQTMETE